METNGAIHRLSRYPLTWHGRLRDKGGQSMNPWNGMRSEYDGKILGICGKKKQLKINIYSKILRVRDTA